MRKLIFFIIIIVTAAGGFGFWNYQKNTYSKDVLRLEILGPKEVLAGQAVEYSVKYKNNGDFRLDNPQLIFEPPSHAIGENGDIFERQTSVVSEAIYPGQEQTFSFKMRILDKEGEIKTAKAILSYQPKGLKARYESSTSFTLVVKSAPITFDFDLSSKTEAGENFTFRANYFSNLDYVLTDMRIQMEYPSGFELIGSSPKSLGGSEWEIPVLNKSQGGRIEIQGKIQGEIGEAKVFRAKLGIWKKGEFILLKEINAGTELINPSIYLRQEINGNPQYVAQPGDWLHYKVYFKNIGNNELNNLFLVNNLEGDAFDFSTIKSDNGNYQPGDNSVVFDWRSVSDLQYLAPTQEGKIDFWIKLKDDLGNVNNPMVKNKVFISQIKEEFTTKIGSKLEIVQKGFFQDEVFGNSGPLPPQAGQTTTYTILWQVKNYYSDVKNVKVKAVLPQSLSLTGKIFPETEFSKFTFDSRSREIVWSVGDLARGTGLSSPGPNVSFQVALAPASYQTGQMEIIGQAEVSGEDGWTEDIIRATASAVTTSSIVR
ncbi:MAG: hypothetical protein V1705_00610 [bacterium]